MTILIAMLFCTAFVPICSARNLTKQTKTRVIHFPKDRSMGLVHVGELRTLDPLWWQGWEAVGQAKGNVRFPLNKAVRLDISTEASEDISPLATLGPDDIQAISFSWNRCDIDDNDLQHLSGLTGLKYLGFSSTQIKGPGLVHLSGLKSLEALCLGRTEISDDSLKHVARLKSLKMLDLSSTKVTDAGLVHLRNLSSLERLSLGSTGISGKGFSSIADTTSINTLWLNHSDITDEGLKHIAKLKSLERLFLVNAAISDTGIEHISRLKALKELNLSTFGVSKMKLSGAALSHMAKLTSLESLELPGGITDADLAKLEGLTGLKRLDIGHMQLTGVGIQTLKEFKLLEYLQLPQGINDKDLAAIKGLNSLEELWIQNSPISNKGIANLSNLKSLKKLGLHNGRNDKNMEVTGSGLDYLKELPSLTSLYVYQLKLDESRLTHLAGLKQLEELEVKQMSLRDEDLAVIGKLTKLKRLNFDSDTVSDGGIAYLANLTALEDLAPWISMTNVGLSYLANMNKLERLQVNGDFTDEGLSHLERLKALRSLRITSGNNFSPAKLAQLQKELPILQRFKVYKSRVTKNRPKIGEVAPKFSLKTIDGKEIKLEDYRDKVVLLYFWATWCSPCVASTPELKKFYEELSQYDGFAMISLSLDENEFGLRKYLERNKLIWSQVRLGLRSQVAADYGVKGVPAYFLIGPDGRIASVEKNGDKLKAAVAKALRK
jgi:peroxiredoxin/Leucine-rich repeat (LRR) protein